MNGKSLTQFALKNLMKRKLRSWLTMLGVVIGVASVVILVSLATGVNQNISSRLNTLGADILQISPGGVQATNTGARDISMGSMGGMASGGGAPSGGMDPSIFGRQEDTLTESDERIIKQIDGVDFVSGVISDRATVSYKTKNTSLTITGVDSSYWDVMSVNLSSGRFLTTSDTYSALVGFDVINQTFQENLLNKYITINGVSFKVVGVIESSSQSITSLGRSVIIPLSTSESVLNTSTYSTIYVALDENSDSSLVQEDISAALISAHHVTEGTKDFSITSQETMQETISSITGTLTLFLGGIGAVSLLVGAIGVANTMFMSVLERTKEIGVLKALGMTSDEITTMFLLESGLIGLIGGFFGLALSFMASFAMSFYGLSSVISIELAVVAVIFSMIVGIVSGIAPAKNAARLEPINALSYE